MAKRSKVILTSSLALALLIGTMSGCASKPAVKSTGGSGNLPTVTDTNFKAAQPETFSMLFDDNNDYPYEASWQVFDQIQKATNIKINITVVPMSDYNTKVSTLIAAGSEPEIIPKTYPGSEVPYIPSGQILPISDYVSQMPNYRNEITDWKLQGDIQTITQKDGKYYVLPELHQVYVQDYSLMIRTDVFKQLGLSTDPKSWDELETDMQAIKKAYPKDYPFSDRWNLGATMQIAGPAFGLDGATGLNTQEAQWRGNNSLVYDQKQDDFSFYPTDANYKTELQFFNNLVTQGLLDPESATQTDDQADAKFEMGKSFIESINTQELNTITPKIDATLGKGKYSIAKIQVPAGPAGANFYGTRLENGIMITQQAKQDPHFSDLLRFVDWLWYSEAGETLTKWGVEGQTFTKTSDGNYQLNSNYTLPAFGLNTNAPAGTKDLRKDLGYSSGVFILTNGGPADLAYSQMTPDQRTWAETSNSTHTMLPIAPNIQYTTQQLNAQNMINQPLVDYTNSMAYKFIFGQANLSKDWDGYVKQCESQGSAKYTDTANSAYKAQKKALSSSSSGS